MKKKFEAKKWLVQEKGQPKSVASTAVIATDNRYDDIEIVTRRIEEAAVDITVGYAAWRDIGFALSDALGGERAFVLS